MNGIAKIKKGLTAIFPTRGRNVTLETLNVAIRLIRPDVALAHVTNQLTGLVNADGQTLLPHQELSTRVLVKDQGAWRITAFHHDSAKVSRRRWTRLGWCVGSPADEKGRSSQRATYSSTRVRPV